MKLALLLLSLLASGAGAQTWRNPADGMDFVWIPTGSLHPELSGASRHTVRGFWIGRTEVTAGQFRRFVEATGHISLAERDGAPHTWRNPGFRQTSRHPAVYLSAQDAMSYAAWAGVDIPTESEWLLVCRGGGSNTFYFGDQIQDAHVWHRDNSPRGTHAAGSKKPSPQGVFDLIGSVYEYCRVESAPGVIVPDTAYPRGGSWTRCPDRIINDLPNPASGNAGYPVLPWDDDRGFRCVRRWTPPPE